MKKKVLSLVFVLMAVLPLCAQKHEVGVLGGAMVGYGAGKANSSTMNGGFRAGAYYRYVPNRWVGVQSGLYYQYFDENREYLVHRRALFNSLMIPVQAVVLPGSRFSLLGGVYMKCGLGNTLTAEDVHNEPVSEHSDRFDLSKSPAFGYEVGVAWNHKHWRLVVSYRQDFASWMDKGEHGALLNRWGDMIFMEKRPRSGSFHVTVEVPLWRNKK